MLLGRPLSPAAEDDRAIPIWRQPPAGLGGIRRCPSGCRRYGLLVGLSLRLGVLGLGLLDDGLAALPEGNRLGGLPLGPSEGVAVAVQRSGGIVEGLAAAQPAFGLAVKPAAEGIPGCAFPAVGGDGAQTVAGGDEGIAVASEARGSARPAPARRGRAPWDRWCCPVPPPGSASPGKAREAIRVDLLGVEVGGGRVLQAVCQFLTVLEAGCPQCARTRQRRQRFP